MSSLLEEAIVDAKALKEAALKNAENAVLEKYSAEVKDAISTLLEQDDLGLGESDEASVDSTFLEDTPYAFQTEELDAPPENELIEIDFDQLKARIEEEAAAGEDAGLDDLMDAGDLAGDLAGGALEEDGSPQGTFLDPEAAGQESGSETGETAIDMSHSDDPAAEEDARATSASMTPKGTGTLQEDEELSVTEEMLSDLIEELVVDMHPVPQGWASINSAYSGVEQANNDAMAAAHDAHLEEDEERAEEESTAPDVTHMVYEARVTKLKESTRELHALLIESKDQLTKLNLENAKLVYQNKALNSASLNERQKNQIVEAVQSANSVEEASMIFEAVQNAVGAPTDPRSRPQTLREAVIRPTSLLMNSKRNNTATHDPKMDRMLRLAGLNK